LTPFVSVSYHERVASASAGDAFEVRVPSREDAILPAADRVIAFVREQGFAGRGEPRLKLALIELITNAMDHGNRFDPTRSVTVRARLVGSERLRIGIADEGPGIDPAVLDRDLDDVALTAKRGRGLGLVKRILGAAPRLAGDRNELILEFGRGLFA
jgi:anti-sigma regulatory factor (Ser/Thr protein kinase)